MTETIITPFYFKSGEPSKQIIFTAPYQVCNSISIALYITEDGDPIVYGTASEKSLAKFEEEYGIRLTYETPDGNTIVYATGEYSQVLDIPCVVTAEFKDPSSSGGKVEFSVKCLMYSGTCYVIRYHGYEDRIVFPETYHGAPAEQYTLEDLSDIGDINLTLKGYNDSWGRPAGMKFSRWTDSKGNSLGVENDALFVPADTVYKVYPTYIVGENSITVTLNLNYLDGNAPVPLTATLPQGEKYHGFTLPTSNPNKPAYRLVWSKNSTPVEGEETFSEGYSLSVDEDLSIEEGITELTLYIRYIFVSSTTTISYQDADGNEMAYEEHIYKSETGTHDFIISRARKNGTRTVKWTCTTPENQSLVYVPGATLSDTCHKDYSVYSYIFKAVSEELVTLSITTYNSSSEAYPSTSISITDGDASDGSITEGDTSDGSATFDGKVVYSYDLPASPTAPEASGKIVRYQFQKWAMSKTVNGNTTTSDIATGTTSVNFSVTSSTSVKFTAVWQALYSFEIIYDYNNGSGEKTTQSYIDVANPTITLWEGDSSIQYIGHNFIGWSTSNQCNTPEMTVSNLSTEAPKTVYAVWNTEGWVNKGEIIVPYGRVKSDQPAFLIPNSLALGTEEPATINLSKVEITNPVGVSTTKLTEIETDPEHLKVLMDCSLTTEDYSNREDSLGDQYLVVTVTYGADIVRKYYAKAVYSNATRYIAVQYYASAGSETCILSGVGYTYGDTYDFKSLNQDDVEKENNASFQQNLNKGQTLVGWNYTKNATTVSVVAGSTFTVDFEDCKRIDNLGEYKLTAYVLKVYAVWAEEYTYTITYKVNGDEGESILGKTEYIESDVKGNSALGVNTTSYLPVKVGYTVDYWYTKPTSVTIRPGEYISHTYFLRKDPNTTTNEYGGYIDTTNKTASITLYAHFNEKLVGTTQSEDVYICVNEPCNIVLAYDEGITNSNYLWWLGNKNPYTPGETTGDITISGPEGNKLYPSTADKETAEQYATAGEPQVIPGIDLQEMVVQMTSTAFYSVAYIVGRPTSVGTTHVYLAHTSSSGADVVYDFNIVVYDPSRLEFEVGYKLQYNMNWIDMSEPEKSQFKEMYTPMGVMRVEDGNIIISREAVLPTLTYYFPLESVFTGHRFKYDDNSKLYAGKSIYGWTTVPTYNSDKFALLNPPDTVLCSYPSNFNRMIYAQWDYITDLYLELDYPEESVGVSVDYGLGITVGARANHLTKSGRYDSQTGRLFSTYDFKLPMSGIHADGYRFMGWKYDRIVKMYSDEVIGEDGKPIYRHNISKKSDETNTQYIARRESATVLTMDDTVYSGTVPIMLDGWAHVMKGVWFSKQFKIQYRIQVPVMGSDGKIQFVSAKISGVPAKYETTSSTDGGDVTKTYTLSYDETTNILTQTYESSDGEEYVDMDILPMMVDEEGGFKLCNSVSVGDNPYSEEVEKVCMIKIGDTYYCNPRWVVDKTDPTNNPDFDTESRTVRVRNGTVVGFTMESDYPKDALSYSTTLKYDSLTIPIAGSSTRTYYTTTLSLTEEQQSALNEFTITPATGATISTKCTFLGWMKSSRDANGNLVESDGYTLLTHSGRTNCIYKSGTSVPYYVNGSPLTIYYSQADAPSDYSIVNGDILVPVWTTSEVYNGNVRINCYNAGSTPYLTDYPFEGQADYTNPISIDSVADEKWSETSSSGQTEVTYVGHTFHLPTSFSESKVSQDMEFTLSNGAKITRTKVSTYYFDSWCSDADRKNKISEDVKVAVIDVGVISKNTKNVYARTTHSIPVRLRYYSDASKTKLLDVQFREVRDGIISNNGGQSVQSTDYIPVKEGEIFSAWKCNAYNAVKGSFWISEEMYEDDDNYVEDDKFLFDILSFDFYPEFIYEETCRLDRYALNEAGNAGDLVDTLFIEGIQSVYYKQQSKLSSTPILTQSSKSTINLDIAGVTGAYTFEFIRVHPDEPDDSSTDSRKWSTAKWRENFLDLADRWQNLSYNQDGKRTGGFMFTYTPKGDIADCIPPIRENVFVSSSMSSEYSSRYVKGSITVTLASMIPDDYDTPSIDKSGTKVLFVDSETPIELVGDDQMPPAGVKYIESTVLKIEGESYALMPDCPAGWSFASGCDLIGWKYTERDESGAHTIKSSSTYDFVNLKNVVAKGNLNKTRYIFYPDLDYPEFISILTPTIDKTTEGYILTIGEIEIKGLIETYQITAFDAILVGGGAGGQVGNTKAVTSGFTNYASEQADAGEVKYVPKQAVPDAIGISVGKGGKGARFSISISLDAVGDVIGGLFGGSKDNSSSYSSPDNGGDTVLTTYINTGSGNVVSEPYCAYGGKVLNAESLTGERIVEGGGKATWVRRGISKRDEGNRFGWGIGGLPFSNYVEGSDGNDAGWNTDSLLYGTRTTLKDPNHFDEKFTSDLGECGQPHSIAIHYNQDGADAGAGGNASALAITLQSKQGLRFSSNFESNIGTYDSRYNTIKVGSDSICKSKDGNEYRLMSLGGNVTQGGDDRTRTIPLPTGGISVYDSTFRGYDPDKNSNPQDRYVSQGANVFHPGATGYTVTGQAPLAGTFGGGGGANAKFENKMTGGISVSAGNGGAGVAIIRWWKR